MRDRLADLIAIVSGLLMPLGFAPFEWRILPVVGLILFVLSVDGVDARRALIRGLLFGLSMFGLGVSWVYNSLHDFGAASMMLSAAIAAGLILINALYLAGLGYWFSRSGRLPMVYRMLLIFPALWVMAEWLRSWILTGFPWLLLGYSQVDTWFGQYAPVGGVLSVGAVVAAWSGGLILVLKGCARDRIIGVILSLVLLAGGWGLSKVTWTQPLGEPLRLSVVQGNIPQQIKLQPDKLSVSLDQYLFLSRPHYSSDIIVWPETAIPTFRHRVDEFLRQLHKELEASDTELLTGVFIYDPRNRRYYNSLHKVGITGQDYHKQRLVPFGEYMPFRSLLDFLEEYIQIPMSDIAAGDSVSKINLAGYPTALSICYESAYADVFREQLPEAAFLVNASNDAWFGDSLAPHQHLEIARMRALEAGRYMVRSTNTGISAIIGPRGELKEVSPQFSVDVLNAWITPYQGQGPFISLGHAPIVLLSGLVLGWAWLRFGSLSRSANLPE